MIVVSDTSPLLYLSLVGAEGILPALFGEVLVPPEVLAELTHRGSPQRTREWLANQPSWLVSRSPKSINKALDLDTGEAAAISLAIEVRSDALLVDDRKARTAAKLLGIVTVGTLTVLESAAEREMLDLPEVVAKLRETNFRISSRLIDLALERDRARRKH